MRGASTLIPARFLTLIGHLCVMVTLLWESKQSVNLCLPAQNHQNLNQEYHNRLVAGFAASIALILLECTTFILGLTMFSPSVSLLSIGAHGIASVLLTHFVLDGWLCDWFWPIFSLCSVLPSIFDTTAAVLAICGKKWRSVSGDQHKVTQEGGGGGGPGGWSPRLALAAAATTLGAGIPVGYNIGVVNTPAEVIKQFCNDSIISRHGVHLDDTWLNVLWSSVVSIFIVGGCTGSILGAVLANNAGRKKATLVTSLLFVLGALCFVVCRAANSVELLILGRLLVGLASGLTTSIVPMYLTELGPGALSAALGMAVPMGVNVGVLLGQLVGLPFLLGDPGAWPYLLSVFAVLVAVSVPAIVALPESPKYLFVVRRNEHMAVEALSRVRGVSSSLLSEELSLLRAELAQCRSAREPAWGLARAAREPQLRLPLLLTCAMQAGQQTSGINAVFYYSQTIFRQAGLSEQNAQYATIGCGFINVCTAVLMLYLLPRMGRRPLLVNSILASAILLAALSASLRFLSVVWWMPYVCTVAVLAYVLAYGLGLGPIPYFIASEMFEVRGRGAGMALGSLASWAGNFLVGMTFPTMRTYIGSYSFLVFSLLTFALYVLQKLYFPETRGRSAAQVAQLCRRGLRAPRPPSAGPPDTTLHGL